MFQLYVTPPKDRLSKKTVLPDVGSTGLQLKDAEGLDTTQTTSFCVIVALHPAASVTIIPTSEHEFPSNKLLNVFPFPEGAPSRYQTQLLPSGLDVLVKLTDKGEQPVVALVEKLGTGNALIVT
jgi:hypothetical protein